MGVSTTAYAANKLVDTKGQPVTDAMAPAGGSTTGPAAQGTPAAAVPGRREAADSAGQPRAAGASPKSGQQDGRPALSQGQAGHARWQGLLKIHEFRYVPLVKGQPAVRSAGLAARRQCVPGK
jgi:hypothetical protein